MSYDHTWAQGVVRRWAELCTRVQLLEIHYEQSCFNMGAFMALRGAENLLKDLPFIVMDGKDSPKARRVWRALKGCANLHTHTLKTMEHKLIPLYTEIRLCALKHRRSKSQLSLFEDAVKLT